MGHVDVIGRGGVAGWAADPARPNHEAFVRVIVNGRAVRVTANVMRDDLKGVFPGATGRYGFELDSNPFPLSPFVDNKVEIVFIKGGTPVPGGFATLPALGSPPLPEARAGKPAPIVLSTTGRAGSSLFMARLARHPDILVARDHPYEVKLLSYYALALRTLVSQADRARSTDPDTMAALANRFFIGFNPFNDQHDAQSPMFAPFWNVDAPNLLRDCFAALVDAYYESVAQQTRKEQPQFFAEKIGDGDLVREVAAFMFGPLHEIVLVRDPRDIICSSRSFWQRDVHQSIQVLRGQFANLTRLRKENGLRQHVVRYEDLLLRPQPTMQAVFDFLGLQSAEFEPDVEGESSVFAIHGTSDTADATVARWRRELSREEASIATAELLPFIEKYGYSLT